ncbi:dihydropteroate synthase [Hydrogenovibrio sp. SC-1]|uniref:dihydropteroate synthase n=1 Tax=Hydrogenovibrio sp. SC-1 TaxID=2065820 RepID=UPI000C7C78C8|nr:dihydropteroate synthase [Hydrogenovibrio sp. SC-1]PLA74208.1 dihydropteroate synthase [Hydrogenovibrio sp. SC-1]
MRLTEVLQQPDKHPLLMGILNVTPDSFSDGGQFNQKEAMLHQLDIMNESGVAIIDIGGESTRPGATPVSLDEELNRVLPVIELVKTHSDAFISVDTYKTEVMAASIQAGVDMINDINALQSSGATELLAQHAIPVCLMHKQGNPETMQQSPTYSSSVTDEVRNFLMQRAEFCIGQGVLPENIIIDPGFGFGKQLTHNVELFENLEDFMALSYPVLVGVSRKTMIGDLLGGAPIQDRMTGSVAAAILASLKGAKIIRVHDVKETSDALKVVSSLL